MPRGVCGNDPAAIHHDGVGDHVRHTAPRPLALVRGAEDTVDVRRAFGPHRLPRRRARSVARRGR